jgi:hypothetical protein
VDPNYQAAVASLATGLPLPPRPLPPWAPSLLLAGGQLFLSAILCTLAGLFAVECWLRVRDTQGDGGEMLIVSVTPQGSHLTYEYKLDEADGGARTERATAPLATAAALVPGGVIRGWRARSLLSRVTGRHFIPEPMRASYRSLVVPLAVCGVVAVIGAVLFAGWFQASLSQRRLLAEGALVRGEIVSTHVQSKLVKPRLALVMRFRGPAGPVEAKYAFRSDRSPVAGSADEPLAGDAVWVAVRAGDPGRSLPWAFERTRGQGTKQLR